ncbi:uncharacterized protein CIMG_12256 [Coccidioides immitis RS]|uniref:Uncharacterized protein n=1 Tax=Coccidioides immitis (strain RS) TaxID=246410 RepID=A0A0D8JVE5_COCIM|nr:uncharacterized protein CIMG_12256 [Coccidioides immitis RS]KJF61300.1 hypothetical protein CIMG_12256 [Coccidioides immitis RS]
MCPISAAGWYPDAKNVAYSNLGPSSSARFAGASIGQSKSIRRRRIPGHNDWESEGLWSDYSLSEAIPTSPIAKHLRNTSTSLIESLFFTFRRLLWQQCYKPTCAV